MNDKTIYALGYFDGVHVGHQALLAACRSLAGRMGAEAGVLTFTQHPDALVCGAAPQLINTVQDRNRLLRQLHIGRITELAFDRALMHLPWQDFIALLCERYGAAGLVCGRDFRFGFRGEGDSEKLAAACAQRGMEAVVVPEQCLDGRVVSSTYIRTLLQQGDLAAANRFLGHPHILSGTVVSGRRLGRTIGIPTANLLRQPQTVQLPHGVYACRAYVGGQTYPAVTNIGTRPTVAGEGVTVEAWLLGFDGDLYGRELTLAFHKFLRPEQKFASLGQLRTEILKNADETVKYLENTENFPLLLEKDMIE